MSCPNLMDLLTKLLSTLLAFITVKKKKFIILTTNPSALLTMMWHRSTGDSGDTAFTD